MKSVFILLSIGVASMTLFISFGIATWLSTDLIGGISGLTIRFFLGYCGIIVVFQVFSALVAIRQLFYDLTEKKPEAIRVFLR